MVGSNLVYGNAPSADVEFPANILKVEDAEDVYENKNYRVRDLYFVNNQGFVVWTHSITNLKPGGQSKGHLHPDAVEMMHVLEGEVFVYLDGVSYRVKAGTYISIDKTVHHKVVNASEHQGCVFTNDFPGHLIRENFTRKKR